MESKTAVGPFPRLKDLRLSMTGVVAVCSAGKLGLVTADTKQTIRYPDGTEGVAYVGICLIDGSPWSSRSPRVVGRFGDFSKRSTDFLKWVSSALGGPDNVRDVEGLQC
jgi:hypothetical protein